jgi:predicted RNA binding protein YcfA (HicA-like mRNA interferase family)
MLPLLFNPYIIEMKSSELIRKFEKGGWVQVRQSGSHKIFKNPTNELTISVPSHGSKEVPTGLVKKLLKQAGLK